jgi:hypothetical protein
MAEDPPRQEGKGRVMGMANIGRMFIKKTGRRRISFKTGHPTAYAQAPDAKKMEQHVARGLHPTLAQALLNPPPKDQPGCAGEKR